MFTLSKSEFQIMKVFWQENRSLGRSEILALSTNKTWKESSIHILINSLITKGALQVAGYAQTGRSFGRTFAAAITQEEYAAMQFTKNVPSQTVSIKNLPKLFETIISSEEINLQILEELQKILNKRKNELSK